MSDDSLQALREELPVLPVRRRHPILIVDDEQAVLDGLKRQLERRFHQLALEHTIHAVSNAREAMRMLGESESYAVIVSDLRMPDINGIQFLSMASQRSPDSVRIMLTGYADTESAIKAINEGQIFRFLTKPCPPEVFIKAILDSLEQHRLINVERELLQETLTGSIRTLVDILSVVNPIAFNNASHYHRYVRHIVRRLRLRDAWRYELAALLCLIGTLTLPAELLAKVHRGQLLLPNEQAAYSSHAKMGYSLLTRIPRLEQVALMIRNHVGPTRRSPVVDTENDSMIPANLGADILRVVVMFHKLRCEGKTSSGAISELLRRNRDFNGTIVRTLIGLDNTESGFGPILREITVDSLTIGMITESEVVSKSGELVVARGQEISRLVEARLRNFVDCNLLHGDQIIKVHVSNKDKITTEALS
jgi:CheY-like chemotaxis protein